MIGPSPRMLNHTVVVMRPGYVVDGSDDWNQPTDAAPTQVAVVSATVQPRSIRELATQHEGGPVVSEYVAFMEAPVDVRPSDYIVHADGVYEVQGEPRDQGGRGRVLEVALERVAA